MVFEANNKLFQLIFLSKDAETVCLVYDTLVLVWHFKTFGVDTPVVIYELHLYITRMLIEDFLYIFLRTYGLAINLYNDIVIYHTYLCHLSTLGYILGNYS